LLSRTQGLKRHRISDLDFFPSRIPDPDPLHSCTTDYIRPLWFAPDWLELNLTTPSSSFFVCLWPRYTVNNCPGCCIEPPAQCRNPRARVPGSAQENLCPLQVSDHLEVFPESIVLWRWMICTKKETDWSGQFLSHLTDCLLLNDDHDLS
jgi:hypothetical protein